MNPADAKHIARGQDPKLLPLSIGFEVADVVTALRPDTEFTSGGGAGRGRGRRAGHWRLHRCDHVTSRDTGRVSGAPNKYWTRQPP
jgi:hypothetical protein